MDRKVILHLSKFIYCYILLFLFFLTSIYPGTVSADDHPFKLRGYIKPLFKLTDFKSLDLKVEGSNAEAPEIEGSLTTTVRFNLFWKPDKSVSSEIAYELTPRIQDPDISQSSVTVQAADSLSYRAVDLGEKMYSSSDNSDIQIFHNIDRAFVTFSPLFGDIHIGRQPIAFGSAHVVNPTDILTSFTYTELNKEERVGIDAVRMKIPVGSLSEIDIGVVTGDNFSVKESAAFLRGKFFMFETDISPLAIIFKQNLLLGFDIAGSIKDAGYWFEGAHVYANIADDHITTEDYFRFSTGLDYSFGENLYAYIEYHFNGAGEDSPDRYGALILGLENAIAYREGAVYLYGRHYIAPGLSYQITPLLTFLAQALYNTGDRSILLSPNIQYSLSDNALIEAGAFAGIGKGSEIIRNSDTGVVNISANSEFSLYPDTFFLSAKYYF